MNNLKYIASLAFVTLSLFLSGCATVTIPPPPPDKVQVHIHTAYKANGILVSYRNISGHGFYYGTNYILTAYHVVNNAELALIRTKNGGVFLETGRCSVAELDITLIKLDTPHKGTVYPFGKAPQKGDTIELLPMKGKVIHYGTVLQPHIKIAIDGAPLEGYEYTLTHSDAMSYPGLSGSAILGFDDGWKILGILMAKGEKSSLFVPVDLLQKALPKLEECVQEGTSQFIPLENI